MLKKLQKQPSVWQGHVAWHPVHGFRSITFRAGKNSAMRVWISLVTTYSATGFKRKSPSPPPKPLFGVRGNFNAEHIAAGWLVVPVAFSLEPGEWKEPSKAKQEDCQKSELAS